MRWFLTFWIFNFHFGHNFFTRQFPYEGGLVWEKSVFLGYLGKCLADHHENVPEGEISIGAGF